MATDVTRDEFKRLETRVDIVESEVEGEKMVSRHILDQTRRNADDLAAIKSRLDRHDQRFDGLDRRDSAPKLVAAKHPMHPRPW